MIDPFGVVSRESLNVLLDRKPGQYRSYVLGPDEVEPRDEALKYYEEKLVDIDGTEYVIWVRK